MNAPAAAAGTGAAVHLKREAGALLLKQCAQEGAVCHLQWHAS
jgi:hypothetical protein